MLLIRGISLSRSLSSMSPDDGVTPFALDPDFDYDNIQQTERFSVARALTDGEFYDRT